MKRVLAIGTIALVGLFAFPLTASADPGGWGFRFGFGSHGAHFDVGYRHGKRHRRHHHRHHYRPHRRHHVHVPVPIHRRIYVPPVYDTVHVGYNACGRPVYRKAIVRAGYYKNVVHGHRCGTCGVRLH